MKKSILFSTAFALLFGVAMLGAQTIPQPPLPNTAAPQVTGVDNTLTGGVIGVILALGAAFLKSKLGISLPGFPASPPAPPVPVPVTPGPVTNRPILDWMAAVLLNLYGKDDLTRTAILAEVEAIKKILDAAKINPLFQEKAQ